MAQRIYKTGTFCFVLKKNIPKVCVNVKQKRCEDSCQYYQKPMAFLCVNGQDSEYQLVRFVTLHGKNSGSLWRSVELHAWSK